ncbi:ribonuclease H2 subunit A-like [Lineus longissimus]|uniref:ribonuclease H2 subunit A-like n=1 Tax=Lineus longissimus TaxID=88925 RepID=UPI002B4E61F2
MDIEAYQSNNTQNMTLRSQVPDVTRVEPCWMGIDEAGRGPVLGPMVYGTCFCPISMKEKLEESGFADSKTLSEEQRENLFSKIGESADWTGWLVEILSPFYISTSMLRRFKYNLNELSHDCAIGMINKVIDAGVQLTEVYVDTVGDPGKYQAKLQQLFPQVKCTVAKKADALYPIVSAASICAKVARDRAVKAWVFTEGAAIKVNENGFGSGYPADPNTKQFLVENLDQVFGFPHFVRFSWSTADKLLQDKAVPVHWDDDEEGNEGKAAKHAKNTPKLESFFNAKPAEVKAKTHRFFTERCLKSVEGF